MKTTALIKDLKPSSFVLIEDTPCRVEKVSISVSGKHGAAKARVDAIGLFDGRRRSIVKPADETIEVPILNKKRAQVLAILGNKAQLMDLTDYSVFEIDIPEEKKEVIKQGEEVEYFEIMGIRTLKELK
jgi:translation initiation factor 5A